MKIGIYTANLSAQDRWKLMQQKGLLLHVLIDTFIAASAGALTVLFRAFVHQLQAPLNVEQVFGGATGAGIVGGLFAGFSWRSAKKKAQRASELDA